MKVKLLLANLIALSFMACGIPSVSPTHDGRELARPSAVTGVTGAAGSLPPCPNINKLPTIVSGQSVDPECIADLAFAAVIVRHVNASDCQQRAKRVKSRWQYDPDGDVCVFYK
jgi:hypothetical protein